VSVLIEVVVGLVIGLAVFGTILYGSSRFARRRQGHPPELDVARTPSEWFTDSRTTDDGGTEVCVVRVEARTGLVRERRVLRKLRNDDPEYKDTLDAAMDDAYGTMRVLNVNLRRR
jgi:hypothetical protein